MSVRPLGTGVLLALIAPLAWPVSETPAPELVVEALSEREGHATLTWIPGATAATDELVFELQTDTTEGFPQPELVYRGPDRGSFRSGLPAGVHRYRVRQRPESRPEDWGPWSNTVSIEVRPYSVALAWSLFGLGAVLVGSIIGYLLHADRRSRRTGEPA